MLALIQYSSSPQLDVLIALSICRIFNTDVGFAGNFSAHCHCLLQASAFVAGVRMKLLSDPSAVYPEHSLIPNHPVTCLIFKNISKQHHAKYIHILYYLCFCIILEGMQHFHFPLQLAKGACNWFQYVGIYVTTGILMS